MNSSFFPANGQQPELDLFPVKEVEVDGIQMGVLNNGVPYLTMRGLSRLCGVDSGVMTRLTTNWIEERTKPRGRRIDAILQSKGLRLTKLYATITNQGIETHAYPDPTCNYNSRVIDSYHNLQVIGLNNVESYNEGYV